jgi:hypothetical protein
LAGPAVRNNSIDKMIKASRKKIIVLQKYLGKKALFIMLAWLSIT